MLQNLLPQLKYDVYLLHVLVSYNNVTELHDQDYTQQQGRVLLPFWLTVIITLLLLSVGQALWCTAAVTVGLTAVSASYDDCANHVRTCQRRGPGGIGSTPWVRRNFIRGMHADCSSVPGA